MWRVMAKVASNAKAHDKDFGCFIVLIPMRHGQNVLYAQKKFIWSEALLAAGLALPVVRFFDIMGDCFPLVRVRPLFHKIADNLMLH